eukprot:CAMPEP_0201516442 /NCGR_PEP_ID=MMETSP0161_2-20130828/7772_1 /ASSEMBLY_ACC=CAM_ASM_000251 /TAXON_ID=180227 /ORGANISM="Neoparamoeba aestuarina, Strain SoJaBio B1-5/56/2" /LENGTH=160 /DNA_ID=CAMNT_0047913579 /DNA_START=227 /DNA_END=709 /DNA_ORIENTATION=+
MSNEVCELGADARQAFDELCGMRTKNCCLILKCDGKKGEVVVEGEIEEDISVDELKAELSESSPRFVLYRYTIASDSQHSQEYNLFIYYNPLSCGVQLKRMYAATKDRILPCFPRYQFIQINEIGDVRETKVQSLVQGNTGQMGERINAQYETHGRQTMG